MKPTLKTLKVKLAKNKASRSVIESAIQECYNAIFPKYYKVLTTLESRLYNSTQYCRIDGDYYQCSPFDPLVVVPVEDTRYLIVYLTDRLGISLNVEDKLALRFLGGIIAIDDRGDVYDTESHKQIVSHFNYATVGERNKQIEAYMEKSGCYPGVYQLDHYGDIVCCVNTLPLKAS